MTHKLAVRFKYQQKEQHSHGSRFLEAVFRSESIRVHLMERTLLRAQDDMGSVPNFIQQRRDWNDDIEDDLELTPESQRLHQASHLLTHSRHLP